MGYVIAAILVLLIVAAGVTFFVLRAARTGRGSAAEDRTYGEGVPGTDAAIVAPDEQTPLGDTDQHAGEQTREGRTVEQPDGASAQRPRESAPAAGDRGAPASGSVPPAGEGGVGGESEGGGPAGPGGTESERLADRRR